MKSLMDLLEENKESVGSRLDRLIEELCPDGVEYKTLESVTDYIKNGFTYVVDKTTNYVYNGFKKTLTKRLN